jgi:periplasmic divalent cation tolerance protein
MSDLSLIYITCPDEKEAESLAERLLEAKLIACANIIPGMKSLYIWKGELNRDNEVILLLKTESKNFEKIEKLILEEHSYECPCIFSLDIKQISEGFLNFIMDN